MFNLQQTVFQKNSNYATAVITELLSPFLRLICKSIIRQLPTPPQQWKRCLITGGHHIGDTLYRTCSLAALKKGLPDCDFYYLTSPISAPLLEHNPYLKDVLPFYHTDGQRRVMDNKIQQLRELNFDAILITEPFKYWRELKLAVRLKIPNRISYVHKGFSGLVTRPIQLDFPQSFPAYFRSFVAQLTQQPADWNLQPEIYPTSQDQQEADDFYLSLNLSSDSRLIACFITSRQPMVEWGTNNYMQTLNTLHRQHGLLPILLGSEKDYAKLLVLQQNLSCPSYIAAGKLSLCALVLFLKRCQLTFCIDSGPRHLSNTAQIPVCFFRHLAYNAVEAGIYYSGEQDLCPIVSYCNQTQQRQILSAINPETVCHTISNRMNISSCGKNAIHT